MAAVGQSLIYQKRLDEAAPVLREEPLRNAMKVRFFVRSASTRQAGRIVIG